jgi:predicted ester cyclase
MEDKKALLHRLFDDVINKGDLDLIDELFTDDFVDHGPMGDMQGPQAFKDLVGRWRSAVPDVHCELDHIIVDGDIAAWLVHTTGTHTGDGLGFPATGKSFETVSANLVRFSEGRAAEHWAEQGMFPMLVQLGLIPVPGP